MVEMQYKELFGIPIYRSSYPLHNETKQSFVDFFDSEKAYKKSMHDIETPTTLFSNPNMHKKEKFKPFTQFVNECLANAFFDMGYEPSFEITSMWGIKQKPKGVHHRHSHNNSFLSGVYYLSGDKQTKGTTFFAPYRYQTILRPRKLEGSTLKPSTRKYVPFTEGTVVIFPSWLEHETDINDSESNRYIMSFNCMPVGMTNWSYYDRYNYQSVENVELIERRKDVVRNG